MVAGGDTDRGLGEFLHLQLLGLENQAMLERAHIADLHEGDAEDAKQVRRIRGEQVCLDHAEHLQHERNARAGDANVESAVEEVLFVLGQAQFRGGRHLLRFNVAQFEHADQEHQGLHQEEERDAQDGGSIDRERFVGHGLGGSGPQDRDDEFEL